MRGDSWLRHTTKAIRIQKNELGASYSMVPGRGMGKPHGEGAVHVATRALFVCSRHDFVEIIKGILERHLPHASKAGS